jgi:transcriptional regulator with XRE-family HTH domain
MNIRQERIEKLPTIGQIINRHEKSAAFRPILGRARLRVAIAREIKRVRERAGLTQTALATALGVSQAMVGRLESVKDKRIPSLELLAKIAGATRSRIVLDQPGIHVEVEAPRYPSGAGRREKGPGEQSLRPLLHA